LDSKNFYSVSLGMEGQYIVPNYVLMKTARIFRGAFV
jgi:hypothetical protein